MEQTEINETIDVGAVFTKKQIKPKWFIWQKRKHIITETTYIWDEDAGSIRIIHFSVTDGSTLFEISLNKKTLVWTLEKTVVE